MNLIPFYNLKRYFFWLKRIQSDEAVKEQTAMLKTAIC